MRTYIYLLNVAAFLRQIGYGLRAIWDGSVVLTPDGRIHARDVSISEPATLLPADDETPNTTTLTEQLDEFSKQRGMITLNPQA